jgi:hypothetical protein
MKNSTPVQLQETADYIRKRAAIQSEINSLVYNPKTMSFEKYAKTAEEKRALKHIKSLTKNI